MGLRSLALLFVFAVTVIVAPLAGADDKKTASKSDTKHSAAWYKTHGKDEKKSSSNKSHKSQKHSAAWYKTHGKEQKHSAAWYKTHGKDQKHTDTKSKSK